MLPLAPVRVIKEFWGGVPGMVWLSCVLDPPPPPPQAASASMPRRRIAGTGASNRRRGPQDRAFKARPSGPANPNARPSRPQGGGGKARRDDTRVDFIVPAPDIAAANRGRRPQRRAPGIELDRAGLISAVAGGALRIALRVSGKSC